MKKILTILIVSMEYPPFVKGGLGIHYYELTNAISKYCKVKIICARTDAFTPPYKKKGSLEIFRIKIPSMFPFNHIYFNLASFLYSIRMQYDIIHLCAPFGLLNTLFKQKPTVTKIHALYAVQKGNFFYQNIIFPLAAFMDKIMISRSDLILTTSKFMQDEIIKRYSINPKKIHYILNGVNDKFKSKKIKSKFDIKSVLYIGRFVKRKNALSIIKAVPDIVKKNKRVKFIFIGGGFTEGTYYENQIKKEIAANKTNKYIEILGWINHDKLINFYKNAYLLIHPSTYEPFGNNIAEAMSAGVPVISTNGGGPKEIIGKSGTLINVANSKSISKTINTYLSDLIYRNKMAKKALAKSKNFSWDKNAKITSKIYESIIIKSNNE